MASHLNSRLLNDTNTKQADTIFMREQKAADFDLTLNVTVFVTLLVVLLFLYLFAGYLKKSKTLVSD